MKRPSLSMNKSKTKTSGFTYKICKHLLTETHQGPLCPLEEKKMFDWFQKPLGWLKKATLSILSLCKTLLITTWIILRKTIEGLLWIGTTIFSFSGTLINTSTGLLKKVILSIWIGIKKMIEILLQWLKKATPSGAKLLSFSVKVGRLPVWAWIVLIITGVLFGALVGLSVLYYIVVHWALPKINTFQLKDLASLLTSEHLVEYTTVIVLIIVTMVYIWRTREKKPSPPKPITPSTPPAPVAQSTPPPTTPQQEKNKSGWLDKWWISGRILPLVTCFILINLFVYLRDPIIWWGRFFNWWSLGLQVGIIMFIMINLDKKKKHWKYVSIVAVLLLLNTLNTLTVPATFMNFDNPSASTPDWFRNSRTSSREAQTALAPLTRSSFEMELKPCLEHDGSKGIDADKIKGALKGYPGLLSMACRESGLNHRDPENPGKILLGKIDPRDLGFLQINTYYHPPATVEKAVGCKDLKEFSCSEKYGKKLYDEYGLEPWFPYGPQESGRQYAPFTVTDTAKKDFGPRINIPRITRETRFDVTAPVIVEVEYESGEKKEFTLIPKQFTDMGISVKWLRFKQSPDTTEEGKVTITYMFYRVP